MRPREPVQERDVVDRHPREDAAQPEPAESPVGVEVPRRRPGPERLPRDGEVLPRFAREERGAREEPGHRDEVDPAADRQVVGRRPGTVLAAPANAVGGRERRRVQALGQVELVGDRSRLAEDAEPFARHVDGRIRLSVSGRRAPRYVVGSCISFTKPTGTRTRPALQVQLVAEQRVERRELDRDLASLAGRGVLVLDLGVEDERPVELPAEVDDRAQVVPLVRLPGGRAVLAASRRSSGRATRRSLRSRGRTTSRRPWRRRGRGPTSPSGPREEPGRKRRRASGPRARGPGPRSAARAPRSRGSARTRRERCFVGSSARAGPARRVRAHTGSAKSALHFRFICCSSDRSFRGRERAASATRGGGRSRSKGVSAQGLESTLAGLENEGHGSRDTKRGTGVGPTVRAGSFDGPGRGKGVRHRARRCQDRDRPGKQDEGPASVGR